MSIRIVTDSTSDISPEVASDLGITVVPGYVWFGDEVYRDGVDISSTEFYDKLTRATVHPTTSEPTPEDFARVYADCSEGAESIISIHISAKISRIYDSALQGKKLAEGECRIEVVDSHFVSVGLALVVMAAARLAKAGESWRRVLEGTQRAISQVSMLGVFDTMRYLVMSDRVSSSIAAMADMLHIKPLLTFNNGEMVRAGLVLTYSNGMDKLYEFVENNHPNVQDLAIAHSTVPEKVNQLKKRLGYVFPEERIHVAQMGSALAVHGGPGMLVVALRRGD